MLSLQGDRSRALVLLALACAAGWAATLTMVVPMRVTAPAEAVIFLLAWVAMLLAMMLPAAVPMVMAYQAIEADRGGARAHVVIFVLGYLLVWTAAGAIPLAGNVVFGSPPPLVAVAVLAGAGLYQLSPWKGSCLWACRAPLLFFVRHRGGPLRLGALHGAICLGCCWALMALMAVVGGMNPLWMVGLGALFVVEKVWRYGLRVSQAAGVGLVAAAVVGVLR